MIAEAAYSPNMEGKNRRISLPTETTSDILRLLSRKKLSRDLYLVNRNIWQIATSSHLVPNVHSIKNLFIDTNVMRHYYGAVNDIQEHVSDFNPKTKTGNGNLIRIDNNSKFYQFPVSYFVQKMSIPEPFVRFGHVRIQHCEDEALIKFLRHAKESFIGCAMTIHFHSNTVSDDEQNKLAYLFENAFIQPTNILLYGYCDIIRRQFTQAKGVLNCKQLKIRYSSVRQKFHQESHGALLNWLQNDYREKSKRIHIESKHLVLIHYPRKMILDMVLHLKKAFEDENSPPAAFLITFLGSDAGVCAPCLEGDHSFYLTKTSVNEKLSFVKQNRNNYLYRLWRRKVISESSDLEMEEQYKRTNIYCSD